MSEQPISTIVDVEISRTTTGVTQAGFGVPLILTDEDTYDGGERVRGYASTTEVLEDWASSTDAYTAAAAIFSQSPQVELVKIGVEATRVAQVQTLVFSAAIVTSNSIAGTVDGVALTATVFNTSNAQTLTDLATKIQATAGVATAVSNGTDTITVTAQNAGVPVSLTGFIITLGASQATITVATTTPNHGVADDLAEISEEDDDWYGLIWNERTQVYVEEAAEYIETVRKIFITCSTDDNILDSTVSTDVATVLSAANYTRTALIFNDDPTEFADAAWMGKLFPYDPGSETWKFKTLAGITADNLTTDERTDAQAKNSNVYVTVGGVDITEEGIMASGEYIDVTRGIDWLQARLEERVYQQLVNAIKIPFTDAGIAIIENEVRAVLQNGIAVGLLSPDPLEPDSDDRELSTRAYTVDAPRAADVSSADKANRLLPDVTFRAVLAGAIHRVEINGTVSV